MNVRYFSDVEWGARSEDLLSKSAADTPSFSSSPLIYCLKDQDLTGVIKFSYFESEYLPS